jgi:hypothetical protein
MTSSPNGRIDSWALGVVDAFLRTDSSHDAKVRNEDLREPVVDRFRER